MVVIGFSKYASEEYKLQQLGEIPGAVKLTDVYGDSWTGVVRNIMRDPDGDPMIMLDDGDYMYVYDLVAIEEQP